MSRNIAPRSPITVWPGRTRCRPAPDLLPNVSYTGQYLYTQGNGTGTGRFIGANGVHEYISEGNVHQSISLQDAAEYRRARAEEALAKARSEIARARSGGDGGAGLLRVGGGAAQVRDRAAGGGRSSHFFDLTQKRERGGEVAHSDSIKAQLQEQQQQRSLRDAEIEMERSRLDLAVMIFPNFNENFSTVDDLENIPSRCRRFRKWRPRREITIRTCGWLWRR